MLRLAAFAGALVLALSFLVPVAMAADRTELPDTGRVIVSVKGDVTLPAGEQADAIVVVQGNAIINGTVNTLVVVDGTATLTGATVEDLVVVKGSAVLAGGTTVLNDVRTLDATVDQQSGSTVGGSIRGLEADLARFGLVLGPALIVLYIGFALATIAAGLLLVALGTRQVRAAADLVRRELGMTLLWGLAGIIVLPIIAVLLMVTVVGIPLGLGLLLLAWPFLAYIGYLFAGVMLGDWLVTRMRGSVSERPYLGAVIGLLLVQVFGIFPPISFVVSYVGMGAVLLLAWRTFRGAPSPAAPVPTSWGPNAGQPVA